MKKNSFLLIVLLLILIGLFLFYNIVALKDEAQTIVEVNLINEANHVSSEFSMWVSGEIRMLETLGKVIGNIPEETLKQHLSSNPYLKITGKSDEPYMGFEDGTFLIGSSQELIEGYDPRARSWYQYAVEKEKTVVSDVYLGAVYGRPMITISKPIYDADRLVGVIGMDVLITEILESLDTLLHLPKSYVYIITTKGIILIHSKHSEWTGMDIEDLSFENRTIIKEKILNSEEESIFYNLNGTPVMAIIRRMKSIDWIVGVAIEEEYIKEEAGLFSRETTIINFLFFIVMLFIVKNLYGLEKMVFSTNEILKDKVYELHMAYNKIDEFNRELEEKSQKDGLTQISNRGYFDEQLELYWKRSSIDGKGISLILIDVDFFKHYNDTYGHDMGDQVLKDICVLTTSLIDEDDFFARIGGEEFAILGYDKSLNHYARLAEGLRKSIVDLVIPHEMSVHHLVTVSIGVHEIVASSAETIGEFYHQTDEAMYVSKKTGRNKVTIFSKDI